MTSSELEVAAGNLYVNHIEDGRSLSEEAGLKSRGQLSRYPSVPPNTAVPSKIRLIHSAPKSGHRENSSAKDDDVTEKTAAQTMENDKAVHGTPEQSTPQTVYTPVYFQIAHGKDILTADDRKKQNGGFPINTKPGLTPNPSRKRVQFFENYYQKAKSISNLSKIGGKAAENPGFKKEVITGKKLVDEGPKRNVNLSQAEAIPIADLQKRYTALNKQLSKSAHVLHIAPRPVAGFPCKPLKTGSFVANKRKGQSDLDISKLRPSVSKQNTSPELCVQPLKYSPKRLSSSLDSESELSLTQISPRVYQHDNILMNGEDMRTPAPFNSCKTSAAGSDVVFPSESVLATRGTMRPWSGTNEGDIQSDLSSTRSTSRSTSRERSARVLAHGDRHESSPKATVSFNAFRPSKNMQQKSNVQQSKSSKGQPERHQAFIMDILQKTGVKTPEGLSSSLAQILQEERKQRGYKEKRKKQQPRSRSLGRDIGEEAIGKGLDFGDHDQSRRLMTGDQSPSRYSETDDQGRQMASDSGNPLTVLTTRGGRDVIFKTKYNYKFYSPSTQQQKRLVYKPEDSDKIRTNDVIKPTSALKQRSSASKTPTATVTFVDDNNQNNTNNLKDFGSSEVLTEKPKNLKVNNDVMFDSSYYEGFQHSKFKGRPSDRGRPSRKYTEDYKSKFLKVSVGGEGTGLPSEVHDSPRSSELTVS